MPVLRPPRQGISYSEALARAYAVAPETEVAIDTLEIIHPSILDESGNPASVRVVNALQDLSATLEVGAPLNSGASVTFKAGYFELVRPTESNSGQVPELELRIGNVSRLLAPYVNLLKNSRFKTVAIWRPYMASDTSAPHISPVLSLTLRAISITVTDLTARAGLTDLTNRRYPGSLYTTTRFPWLTVR